MKSILRRRPSPALVISCIALFVSLGGVSYGVATGFIDSREIKNNSVRSADIRNSSVEGRDVAPNTLKGADISEQDLGKVPTASVADAAGTATSAGTAATAGSAGSVAGVTLKSFNWQGQTDSGWVEVLNLGGLKLEAQCDRHGSRPPGAGQSGGRARRGFDANGRSAPPTTSIRAFTPWSSTSPGDAAGTIAYTGANGRVVTCRRWSVRTRTGWAAPQTTAASQVSPTPAKTSTTHTPAASTVELPVPRPGKSTLGGVPGAPIRRLPCSVRREA